MGGGALTSYACRHLDPTAFPYAAILNYAGTMSAARGWEPLRPHKTNPGDPDSEFRNHPLMFGGSPADQAFAYQIASCIHLWPKPGRVDPASDLLRNIPALHVATVTVSTDTHDNVDQCTLACAHAASLGFPWFTCPLPIPPVPGAGGPHNWEHLQEGQALTWLELFTFNKPSGRTRILADRSARYYDIDVTPTALESLCPFEYEVVSANHLQLKSGPEISQLSIHSADMGLVTTPTFVLSVDLQGPSNPPATPIPLKLQLTDYTTSPGLLLRNTIPQVAPAWSWNAATGVLTINEPDVRSSPQWMIL